MVFAAVRIWVAAGLFVITYVQWKEFQVKRLYGPPETNSDTVGYVEETPAQKLHQQTQNGWRSAMNQEIWDRLRNIDDKLDTILETVQEGARPDPKSSSATAASHDREPGVDEDLPTKHPSDSDSEKHGAMCNSPEVDDYARTGYLIIW
ncbi:uncharacterized protein PG986_001748 [Apiospora aurea]|uniref:Uncharacterized protein n=1 Tax=Apiospora aurea TaxID=335848 RepID=A0ABR1QYQ3_9PEZI